MKQCTKCGMEKIEEDFSLNRYGDKTYRRNVCRDCYNAAKQNHEGDEKPDELTCRKCGEYKPIAAFPRQRQCSYGVEPVCKACKVKRRQEFVALYPERARSVDLKAKYGITLEDYRAMFARQEGRCAICGVSVKRLVVDHNHKTGKVRALLCHHCNTMIGSARESISTLVNAAAYLYAEQEALQEPVRAQIIFSQCDAASMSNEDRLA